MLRSAAASVVRTGFLIVWVPLDVGGFRPVLARGWHDGFGTFGSVQLSRSQVWRESWHEIIVHHVDFLVQLLIERVSGVLFERVKRRRADGRMSRGKVDCALKVMSGSQRGLSRRWRQVSATVSPGRLDVRGHWWRLFRAIPPVTVVAVRSPARLTTTWDDWTLAPGCRIVEIQTPTATLAWAMIGHRLSGALEQLQHTVMETQPGAT